jgi:very-short-patch-repair endonuclease
MAGHARTLRARELRRNATDAERRLWRALRELGLPFKVRRQHPIGTHIADFAIPACKLVIEIDGGQHADAVEEDGARTDALNAEGYRVVRFWNSEVLGNLEGVLQSIVAEVGKGPTSP